MKLTNLDQQIFVPITDETNGSVTYEMGMSLGEFLDGICEGFKPEVVEAIPVEWLKEQAKDNEDYSGTLIRGLLSEWWKEQRQKEQGEGTV